VEGASMPEESIDYDKLWAARAKAIQEYASLEQSLCSLFAYLGGIQQDIAGIIFFKITSAQARNSILERLFKKKFGDQFNLFRSSLIRRLTSIDNERNAIVHWNTAKEVRSAADFEVFF
jgi:hypothetical protein